MPSADLLELLRTHLPTEDVAVVYAALKRDQLVWEFLQDSANLHWISTSPLTAKDWSPANVVLRILNSRMNLSELQADHFPSVEPSIRKKALEIFEQLLRSVSQPKSLKEAGLIAIALRERRRKTQTWLGLMDELKSINLKNQNALIELWKTPLLCLFGMTPDAEDLLKALLSTEDFMLTKTWITHILLGNPIGEEETHRLFMLVLKELPSSQQIDWLIYLKNQSEDDLAGWLANQVLRESRMKSGNLTTFDGESIRQKSRAEIAGEALELQWIATLHQIAGHPAQSELFLNRSKTLLQHWLGGTILQLISVNQNNRKSAEELWDEVEPLLTVYPLTDTLLEEAVWLNPPVSLIRRLNELNLPGFLQALIHGQSTAVGENRVDREIIGERIREWVSLKQNEHGLLGGQFVFGYSPWELLNVLGRLGLHQEGLEVAQIFLNQHPRDIKLMTWTAQTAHRLGQEEKALSLVRQSILLEENNPDHYRLLAQIHEDSGDWDEALRIREEILARFGTASIQDLLSYVNCAIGGKHFDLAIETCQKILHQDEGQGKAYTLLGIAQIGLGKTEEALASLNKATLLVPEDSTAWLELARLYNQTGEPLRAMETLRAALLNVPNSAELHLAMGKACLSNGLSAEALPYLKQSARLAPESDEVALALIRVLTALGHFREALEVAEKSRHKWPAHADLAYEHARLLLQEGSVEEGISVLEVALQFKGAQPEWFVEYAEVLLNGIQLRRQITAPMLSMVTIVKAQKALQRVLREFPQHFLARLLNSEIHLILKEWDRALMGFKGLLDVELSNLPEWHWRIHSGLGLIAFHEGDYETALAALQSASQSAPESIEIKELLAEVYYHLNLKESAIEVATQVRKLQPNSTDHLLWFAEFMDRMNEIHRSIEAMQILTQLFPYEVDFALKLAKLRIKEGNEDAVNEEIKRVLGLDQIQPEQLLSLAKISLLNHNLDFAIQAIQKAIRLSGEPSYIFHYRLALLYWRTGRIEEANQELQTALILEPNSAEAHIFQSELHKVMKRPQAAMASLEKALRILESQTEKRLQPVEQTEDQLWGFESPSLFSVHRLFVPLCLEAGELGLALYHAQSAMEYCPFSLEMGYWAAALSRRLLQPERFGRYADLIDRYHSTGCFTSFTSDEEAEWLAGLHAYYAENQIEAGDFEGAGQTLLKGLAHQPENLHLRAVRSRLNAKLGNFSEAIPEFQQLLAVSRSDLNSSQGNRLQDAVLACLCETAFDLLEWRIGFRLAEEYLQLHESEPLGYLILASGYIRAMEWQRLMEYAGVKTHALTVEEVKIAQQRIGESLEKAETLSHSRLIEFWKARAGALQHPDQARIQALSSWANTDEDYAWLVEVHLRGNNYAAAFQMTELWRHHPLVQVLAALLWENEDPQRALGLARSAVELAPHHPIYQAILAKIAEKNEDYAQAFEAVEVAVSIWDDEIEWHIWAAALAELCGVVTAAAQHLEKALLLKGNDYDLLIRLARHYLKNGLYEQAVQLLQQNIHAHAERSDFWLILATALQGVKNDKEALRAAEKAIELDGENGRGWIIAGEIALRMGDENKALQFARQAEKVAPAEAGTRLLAAKILKRQGQVREALAEIEQAIEEIPAQWELHYERAQLVLQLQGAAAAQQILQELVKIYPENEQILWLYAQTCMKTGKIKLAEQSGLQALKFNPHNVEVHRLLAEVFTEQGQLDRAVYHLGEAVRLQPDHMETYLRLAEVYSSRREFNKALSVYQQAIQINPHDYRPYYQSALVLRDGKDYPGAEVMLRRAAELAPDDVNIRRQLGAIVALNLVHHGQEAKTCL